MKTLGLSKNDFHVLRGWLLSGATASEIAAVDRVGLVDNERFSERARLVFMLLWEWSCHRFSSASQDRYWHRRGNHALERRFKRTTMLIKKIKESR